MCTTVSSAVLNSQHIPANGPTNSSCQLPITAKFKGVQTQGSPNLSQLRVVERVVQDRHKLHFILQVFPHTRFSNLHFKSTHAQHEATSQTVQTTAGIGGHFAPDPVIVLFHESPCRPTLAGQGDQLPSSCLQKWTVSLASTTALALSS